MNNIGSKSVKIRRFTAAVLGNAFVIIFSIFCLFPVFWMLYSSLKTQQEFALNIISLPKSMNIQNYADAIKIGQMGICFANSVKASLLTILLILFCGFPTGIIFGRFNFKYKNFLYLMFLSGMLIPIHSLLVPVFIEMKMLQLHDNIYAIALLYTAFGLPLAIFLITSFASAIPKEIEEAAIIDGSNFIVLIFKILLPICLPIVGTVLILSFLSAWNEFPFALVLLGRNSKTVPIGLTYFSGMYTVNYPQLMAGLSIATIPVLIVYFAFSKQIVTGMVAGAVKG